LIEVKNKLNATAIEDPCGPVRFLYYTDKMSICHVTVFKKTETHLHKIMEEAYFIDKGRTLLTVGEDATELKEGDTVSIPKDTWHTLENLESEPLEVLVANCPALDQRDIIMKATGKPYRSDNPLP